jgi:hypothetical protein
MPCCPACHFVRREREAHDGSQYPVYDRFMVSVELPCGTCHEGTYWRTGERLPDPVGVPIVGRDG